MKAYNIDLHLHTTASDGSDTPRELTELARAKGLSLISITDHDTIKGSVEAIKSNPDGIKIVTGIEFSCHCYDGEDFDCHILGYGFDPASPSILGAISHGREMRLKKLDARLEFLKARHGISFEKDDIDWLYSLNSAAKPHLGRLIVRLGLADTIADAIDKYLKGEGFPDDRIDAGEAIKAILDAGGIPVWAHPLGGEREKSLTRDELEARLKALIPLGLRGLECLYSRYSKDDERWLLSVADKHGLFASGGSDYHGRNKTVELARLSAEGDADCSDISIASALLGE